MADYGGGLTVPVVVTCLMAASGGLIFGYDIGISGAPPRPRPRPRPRVRVPCSLWTKHTAHAVCLLLSLFFLAASSSGAPVA
jgi:hypothetical protein